MQVCVHVPRDRKQQVGLVIWSHGGWLFSVLLLQLLQGGQPA
jgi:hypothetical protein